MRIAVTGALGHIGSRVLRDLPEAVGLPGMEIVAVDNLSTNRYPSLFDLPQSAKYRFIEADVARSDLREMFVDCRAVIHLAAMTDAASSHSRAQEVEDNNYDATDAVIRACLEVGSHLIACSSTSVYGSQESVQDESCPEENLRPQSPYATTKLREERAIKDAVIHRGLRAHVLRLGTIFGTSPGMRFHTAVNRFCWQAAMGQPLSVWRTALDQKRPYLDLEDAIQAFALLLQDDIPSGDVLNVVTENATVRRVVDSIRRTVPDLAVELVDSPIMNQLSYEVACDRIFGYGFRPKGNLDVAIDATLLKLKACRSF